MRVVGLIVSGLLALLLLAVATSSLLRGNWVIGVLLLVAAALCLPMGARPFRGMGEPVGLVLRLFSIAFLVLTAALPAVFGGPVTSVYSSPDVKARLDAIYDERLAAWPVRFEQRMLETTRGQVHVISAGPEDAPALILLHASGVASWSWGPNMPALAAQYRVHAIDLIGDAGKSALSDLGMRFRSGADQAAHYAEVMDLLGIERAAVIGASEGGFIATNLALHHPGRVERMALLGPMGYSGAIGAVARIFLTQFFPVPALQRATFRWAFSDDPALLEDYAEWFALVMSGLRPAKVPPLPFGAEARAAISVPTLFVFGTRDRLVGDAETARALVQDVPGAQVRLVAAGHLMAAESPDVVDPILLSFLSAD